MTKGTKFYFIWNNLILKSIPGGIILTLPRIGESITLKMDKKTIQEEPMFKQYKVVDISHNISEIEEENHIAVFLESVSNVE